MILNNAKDLMLGDRKIEKVYIGSKIAYSRNIFDENSEYAVNRSCGVENGALASSGGERLTFFFKCKQNTKYKIICDEPGDRLCVYVSNRDDIDTLKKGNNIADKVYLPRYTVETPPKEYEFTTEDSSKTAWVYLSLNKKPKNVKIREMQ